MTLPTLILAAHEAAQLDAATARAVTAARAFGQPVHVLVLGPAAVARQAARLHGVACVHHAEAAQPNAETAARALALLAGRCGTVLATHHMLARGALPRAAALCGAVYLADVVAVPSADSVVSVVRAMYAGSVLSTVQAEGRLFLTVRASAFAPVAEGPSEGPPEAVIAPLEGLAADTRSQLTGKDAAPSGRPDLARARVVVAGGRGVGAAQNMRLVEALADRLGGAVGASRAAVDAGFAPNAMQVGQTGKVVAPALYIAAGISGAIQHVAGIKDAKVIVAINKDPDAPIFSIADIGLVGDLFEVLPALTAQLPALADA